MGADPGPLTKKRDSETRKEYLRAYQRRWQEARVLAGVCVSCGLPNDDRPGERLCGACLIKSRRAHAKNDKAFQAAAKLAGICKNCRMPIEASSTSQAYCNACRLKTNAAKSERDRLLYASRRARGVCAECEWPNPDAEWNARCPACSAKHAAQKKAARLRKAGGRPARRRGRPRKGATRG